MANNQKSKRIGELRRKRDKASKGAKKNKRKRRIKIEQPDASNKIINILSILGIILTVVFSYWGYKAGIFTDEKALSNFLDRMGIMGPIIFMFIQVIQTVVPIIPGAVTCVAGIVIFGVFKGFLYNYIGIMTGSVINFYLARKYGRDFVRKIFNAGTYNKYIGWLDHGDRFEKLFTIGMIIPVSPADFLCYIAGLSKMKFSKYFTILAITKPFTLVAYTLGLILLITTGFNFIFK